MRGLISLAIVLAAFGAAWFVPPKLGLDLSGGTQIVLETQDGPDTEANADNTDKVIEVLRERIDSLGVSEATMSRSGENRIIVELPGVQDPTEAAELIGQTAQLTFHPVLGVEPAQQGGMPGGMPGGGMPGGGMPGGGAPGGGAPGGGAPAPGDGQNAPADDANAPAASGKEGGEPKGGEQPEMSEEQLQQLLQQQQGQQGGGGAPAENPDDVKLTLPDESGQQQLQLGATAIKGDQVGSAEAALDEFQSNWMVNVNFRGQGPDDWKKLTGEAACNPQGDPKRRVAIVLDDKIISSPEVNQEFSCKAGMGGGQTSITGNFTKDSANDLAVLIEGGSLPLPVEEVQRQTVGPTLGADAIEASAIAAGIGILLTALYICAAYRLVGFLASVALACYTLLAYAALVALGATLTLPGLAGFVLAIGMAIDANVLIFERAREEYQRQEKVYAANKAAGMSDAAGSDKGDGPDVGVLSKRKRRAIPPNLEKAFVEGTKKAWSAVLDTNVTTLIAAALLFFLATGTVQGFGVTLGLGTLASMISALVIARVFVQWAVRRSFSRKHPGITGISRISKVRQWLVERNPDLMKRSTMWLGIAGLVTAIAVLGMLVRPPNLGVEFTGGRVLDFDTQESISVADARSTVSDAGFPEAVVQESGDGGISVRTGQITDGEAKEIQDSLSEVAGDTERISDEKIGPSMGNELRNKALIALVAALALQMAYLAWRFRWSFGVATMAALLFDVVVVVGLFCWLGKPIDGVFLAAILSVVGFSVNDSVVVFDRVRDEWAHDTKSKFSAISNRAILHTLPRTVNSGIGAIFILGALAFLGGSSLTDFSIAMLVGLISGMVSTVFVGSPLSIWLQKYDRTPPPHEVREKKTKQRKELRTAREESDGAVV